MDFNTFRNRFSEVDRSITLEQFSALSLSELNSLILAANLSLSDTGQARLFYEGGFFSKIFKSFFRICGMSADSVPPSFTPVPLHSLFIYEAIVTSAKIRKSFRFQVYQLAEEHCGCKRNSNDGDGIFYNDEDYLRIQLVFEKKSECYKFQTQVRRKLSKKRKLHTTSADNEFTETITRISPTSDIPLTRVFESDYHKLNDDPNPTNDCDGNSISSTTTTVEVDELIKLRLLDDDNSGCNNM